MVAIAVLVAISLVAAVPLANWIQRRRLQPILAGLPLTQERITLADMRKNARTATPFKQSRNAFIASVFASFAAVAAAYSHYAAKPGLDAQLIIWTFNAVLWGSLAFVWYRRALRKASETSTEVAKPDSARFVRLSQIVLLIAASGLVVLVAGLQVLRKHSVPTAPDYAMARVQYETAAAAGNAAAMNSLGWLYQSGLGVSARLRQGEGVVRESRRGGQRRGHERSRLVVPERARGQPRLRQGEGVVRESGRDRQQRGDE